jgi:integrase
MASHKLTARFVETVKKPGKYCDGDGLWLCVSATGRKTWIFRWMRDRKSYEMGLDSLDFVSLAQAREKAHAARTIVRNGGEPRLPAKKIVEPTFQECAEEYLKAHASWSDSHSRYWKQLFRDYVYPVNVDPFRRFGNIPVSQIDTAMVRIVLDQIWNQKPRTAGDVRYCIEAILDFAAASDYRNRDAQNPARWDGKLEHLYEKPTDLQKRRHFRSLKFPLCPALATDLGNGADISAVLAAFDLRVVLRAGNGRYAEWDWVDWDQNILNVPAKVMKGEKKIDYPDDVYQVPLSTGAMAILRQQYERRISNLIFPGIKPGKPISSGTIYHLMERLNYDTTTHGFRASFRTWADNRTICEDDVKEMALGHALGDKTREAYSRSDLFDKRRHLMQAWDDFLTTGTEEVIFIGISDPNLLDAVLRQISKKLNVPMAA